MSQGKPLYPKKGKVVYPVILLFFPLIERRCLTKIALRRSSHRYALLRPHTFTSTLFHPLCVRFLMCVSAVASPTFLISFLPSSDRQKQKKPASLQAFFHVCGVSIVPCGASQSNGLTGVWVGDRPSDLLRLLTPCIRGLREGNEKFRCHPHAASAAHPHPLFGGF